MMNISPFRSRRRRYDRGITLIEMMIAITLLAVGLGAGIALVSTAIASNARNRNDTAATLLAQMVMEQILAQGASATTTWTITDCTGTNSTVDPTSSSTGRGAPLTSTGSIDYTQTVSPSTGYNMNYTVCKAAGSTEIYDVRWNITTLSSSGVTIYRKRVSVAARPLGATSNSSLYMVIPPVTVTGVAGN